MPRHLPPKPAIHLSPAKAHREFVAKIETEGGKARHSLIIHDATRGSVAHEDIVRLLSACKMSPEQIRAHSRGKVFSPLVLAQEGGLELVLIGRQMQFNKTQLPFLRIQKIGEQ